MELIDVITSAGTPAGRVKPKDDIHRDGDWHRTAHVWIVTDDRRVLLQKRAETKVNYPGLWDVSSAGHVSAGETPLEASVREVAEELGIEVREEELTAIGEVRESAVLHGGTYVDNELHTVFLVRRNVEPESVGFDAEEVEAVMLETLEELRERVRRGDPSLVPHPDEYALLFQHLGV